MQKADLGHLLQEHPAIMCVCVSLYVGMRKCLCLGKPEGNSRMPGAEVAGRVNHMIGLGTVLWSFVRTASTTH